MRQPLRILGLLLPLFVSLAARGEDVRPLFESGQLQSRTAVQPLSTANALTNASLNATATTPITVPTWTHTITSPLNKVSYTAKLVGKSPYVAGSKTTTLQTRLIPVKIIITDSKGKITYDPSVSDACAPGSASVLASQSPLFKATAFTWGGVRVGNTQYADAFRRASFWDAVSGVSPNYHLLLSLKTLPTITLAVPAAGSGINQNFNGGCTPKPGTTPSFGLLDMNWLDDYLQTVLLPALTVLGYVNPTQLPVFLLYNVALTQGAYNGQNCCTFGYHSAYYASASSIQTYAVANYDSIGISSTSSDVALLSHEILDWLDNPFGNNRTPAWGHVGQVVGCQANLETADPLTDKILPGITMSNGFTYHLQEAAFFSWFYRQAPSSGVHGWYSNNGSFTTTQGVCQ